MTDLRHDWLDTFAKLLAASCGVSIGGPEVMPYNPAILEAAATGDMEMT